MKAAVIRFPGSNCDRDMFVALKQQFKDVSYIWHDDNKLPDNLDLIAIPGGFSYGDYLRCGSMAANSKIMQEVKKFANKGGYIIGVCNGFQILTEANLVPGVLLRNEKLKFISKRITLEVVNRSSKFTHKINQAEINIPIAHHDGNYFCTNDQLKALQDNEQIAFKYQNNVNGSIANIAGILNKNKNILAMMPHPERAVEPNVGGVDGKQIFLSILS
ncbi:MAG: phosphoribosylformylglycinamidine synthase subunit PurQ [Alphaproteobacteria bacterium]|nr:phosphoribosylformylglycinamidine synthase subunit PurQ [Alphaproteobacteria bacterium]